MINNSDSGEVYGDGAIIIQQGDAGSAMYVIQKGEVEVLRLHDGKAIRLAVLGQGDIFGELSLFGNNERSATVRALGDTRVLAVDKNVFLRRIQEDLTLALRMFHNMAARLDHMNVELTILRSAA